MSKRQGRRKNNRSPKNRPRARHLHAVAAEPDLLEVIDAAAADEDPGRLLALVSTMVDVAGDEPGQFAASLIGFEARQTSAALAVFAALVPDPELRHTIAGELAARAHVLPQWVVDLPRAVALTPVRAYDEFGDSESVLIAARFPDGRSVSLVLLVDHNEGSVAADGFVADVPHAEAVAGIRAHAGSEGIEVSEVLPAVARARIERAIDLGLRTVPPYETETWPSARPLARWLCRLLPEGGSDEGPAEWTQSDREGLIARFLASPQGAGMNSEEHGAMLDAIVWFGTDYSTGDPMRWSAPKVAYFLFDWVPNKFSAFEDALPLAPSVLRAFIQFAHTEVGISAEANAQTIAGLNGMEPDYQRELRDREAVTERYEPFDFAAYRLEILRRAVGGGDALAALDAAELPDEPFAWESVPDEARAVMEPLVAMLGDVVTRLAGVEYRTACYRLLARAAAGHPETVLRGKRLEITAAALFWAIGKANDFFDANVPDRQAKNVIPHFGVKAVSSQRAHALLDAAGCDLVQDGWSFTLGDPNLLVSERRKQIIAERDRFGS